MLEAAGRLLEARPRAADEVRRRLVRLGYRVELVEAAIGRLLELGWLDDEAFARQWLESRDRAHPRGEALLRRELLHTGVERELVDRLLDERRAAGGTGDGSGPWDRRGPVRGEDTGTPGDADEAAADRLLARRGAGIAREADPRRRRQKAYALLARHGFAPEICGAASARYLAALGAPADGDEDLRDEAHAEG